MNELECDESSAIEWFECNIEQALKTGKTGKAYNASIAALKWKQNAQYWKEEYELEADINRIASDSHLERTKMLLERAVTAERIVNELRIKLDAQE